jgi:predicted unusual protein kinase regulating ubiquinone biosynthesis (AarF/ABC1/UbiB family)
VNASDLAAAATPANASRYAALVRLLLRHGRSDLVSGADLDEYAVDDLPEEGSRDQAEEFTSDLESMGPTYIKLGQLLSSRVELLPAA